MFVKRPAIAAMIYNTIPIFFSAISASLRAINPHERSKRARKGTASENKDLIFMVALTSKHGMVECMRRPGALLFEIVQTVVRWKWSGMNWPQKGTKGTKERISFFVFFAFLGGNCVLASSPTPSLKAKDRRCLKPHKSLIFMIFSDISHPFWNHVGGSSRSQSNQNGQPAFDGREWMQNRRRYCGCATSSIFRGDSPRLMGFSIVLRFCFRHSGRFYATG
jgi:hypothetical protein